MKSIFILCFFLALMQTDLQPTIRFTAPSDFILTDAIGNIYSVKGNNITSYSGNGQKLFSYANLFMGNITYVDVKDPMRILLFFKDFNKVVFLSNKLSELGSPIELDNAGYSGVSICCTSHLGGIWLFDSQALQLVHLNANLEPVQKGTVLQNIFKNSQELPVRLIEDNDMIYMSLPKTGLLVFDKFGAYQKTIPIMNIDRFEVFNDKIIQFSNHQLYSYNEELMTDSISLPENLKIVSASIYKNQIVASNKEEIFIFNLQN
jgi:hypothetical protein